MSAVDPITGAPVFETGVAGVNVRQPSVAEVEDYLRRTAERVTGMEDIDPPGQQGDAESIAKAREVGAQAAVETFFLTAPDELVLLTDASAERLRALTVEDYGRVEAVAREKNDFFFNALNRLYDLKTQLITYVDSQRQSASSSATATPPPGPTH